MVEGRLYVELGSLSLPLLPFLCVHNDHIERQRRQTNRIQRIKRTFIEKKGLDFFLAFAFYIIAGLEWVPFVLNSCIFTFFSVQFDFFNFGFISSAFLGHFFVEFFFARVFFYDENYQQ